MRTFTPREVVSELDRYIVGQEKAKRAVAVALRNRWRRQRIPKELREEVAPKNILMIGPTGVGKTEIARRLARLAQSPFLKVEASKFTEVGYVGRDVESMIRDLIDMAVNMVRQEEIVKVQAQAEQMAEERILDLLLPGSPAREQQQPRTVQEALEFLQSGPETSNGRDEAAASSTREKLRRMYRDGALDDRYVEVEVSDRVQSMVGVLSAAGLEDLDSQLRDMLGNIFPGKTKKRKVPVSEAKEILTRDEAQKLLDTDRVTATAKERVENGGIIFIDEIDKIASRNRSQSGPGRIERGRPKGHPANRGRNDGEYQARVGSYGSYPVHFRGGFSYVQAFGSDPGAPGPLPHPGGTQRARLRRLHPHPQRAGKFAAQTV